MANLELINNVDTIAEIINTSNQMIELIVTDISQKAYLGKKPSYTMPSILAEIISKKI